MAKKAKKTIKKVAFTKKNTVSVAKATKRQGAKKRAVSINSGVNKTKKQVKMNKKNYIGKTVGVFLKKLRLFLCALK